MFKPPLHTETRVSVMHALMRHAPFATVICQQAGDITADHIPLVLETTASHGILSGHLAKVNPLYGPASDFEALSALAIFHGPHTYISPSWYASKAEHGKAVPTWNYIVVHARGNLRFHTDRDWMLAHLEKLTNQHESGFDAPWKIKDAPQDYIGRLLRHVVGFEINIQSLEGVWKTSQNKSQADRDGVRAGLVADLGLPPDDAAQLVS